jgi:signal transduction histidine kinase
LAGGGGVALRGSGLAFALDFQGKRLGLVSLEDFAMPERRDDYRNLLEAIIPICSLSLNNAHNFEALKRNEAMLRSRQDELQRMVEARDRLFSIIGHDLRGPVGSMRDLLRYIVEESASTDALPGNQGLMLSEILQAAEHIYLLMINLLDWGKSQASTLELRPEDFIVKEQVEDVFGLLSSQAASKGVTLVNAAEPDFRFLADAATMQTVLRNLAANALKFTPGGGTVTVRTEAVGPIRRVLVEDSGLGMDAAALARALDFSKRRSTPGTRGERGVGLGLVLCDEFVKKNGGAMRVESEEGKGTKVALEFRESC